MIKKLLSFLLILYSFQIIIVTYDYIVPVFEYSDIESGKNIKFIVKRGYSRGLNYFPVVGLSGRLGQPYYVLKYKNENLSKIYPIDILSDTELISKNLYLTMNKLH